MQQEDFRIMTTAALVAYLQEPSNRSAQREQEMAAIELSVRNAISGGGGGGGVSTNTLSFNPATNAITSTVEGIAGSAVISLDSADVKTTTAVTVGGTAYPIGTSVQTVLDALAVESIDALQKSPDGNTYTDNQNGTMNFIVDGLEVGQVAWVGGVPKWTLNGILDPSVYAGTPLTVAQRNALTAQPGYMVYISDGSIKEYQYWDGTMWLSWGGVSVNDKNVNISRADAVSGVAPTALEFPIPGAGASANIRLTNGVVEFWNFTTVWAKAFETTPATIDGNLSNVLRADAIAAVAPTALEVASPINGDTAIVFLTDGKVEYWSHNGTAWALNHTVSVSAVPVATDAIQGVVELATDAEMTAGTATNLAITPANAKVELDKKVTKNAPITAATKTKITYNADGLVTAGTDATAADILNVPAGNISATDVQAAINELDTEKLSGTLTDGKVFIGNASNVATEQTLSGDVTITNAGVATVVTASDTVAGKVEFATIAETQTGTDATRAITPAGGEATYAKKPVTTSLTPKVYSGAAFVNAQANLEANVADVIELSDGSRVSKGYVIYTAHGLTIGDYYYLSQGSAGVVTNTVPPTGIAQRLFFVVDANTILIDVLQASIPEAEPTFAQTVYIDTITPATATIFSLTNPPVVHNAALIDDVNNLYVGTDSSTWTYNAGTLSYSTYVVPAATPFVLAGTAVDAGDNKTGAIGRTGNTRFGSTAATTEIVEITGAVADDSGLKFTNLTSTSPTSTGTAIGVDATGKIVTVAGGAANALQNTITQTAHGFSVGDAVYWNGAAYAKAKADAAATSEVLGVVSVVADANTFTIVTSGQISTLSGLTPGEVYWLSDATAGLLTTTQPTADGSVSKPILVAITATTAQVQIFDTAPASGLSTEPLTYGRVNALFDLASTTHINTDPGTKIPFTGTVYTSGMTVNAGALIPSVAGRYRADWLCMATSTDFLADGIFFVVQNGVSVGQTSYNMNEASAVNQSAGFIDVNLVAGQEVSLNYRTRHTASDGIAWDRGSYFQLTQLPTAVAPVVNTVAEYIAPQYAAANVTPTSVQNTSANAAQFMSIAIPSAGVWDIEWSVLGQVWQGNGGGTNDGIASGLYDSAGTFIANTELSSAAIASAGSTTGSNLYIQGTRSTTITTTAATTFNVKVWNPNGLTRASAGSGVQGRSYIKANKIAGQLPSTGQTVDYVSAQGDSTTYTSAAALSVATLSGNIPNASGVFTLTAGKTYRLQGSVRNNTTTTQAFYHWRDIGTNTLLGTRGVSMANNAAIASAEQQIAEAIFTPSVNTTVRLENISGVDRTIIDTFSWITIVQLGSTSNTVGTLPALDQSSAGYFDIGNMRMQWGTLLHVPSTGPVTFPAPFANTSYTVVVSSAAPVNIFVTTGAKATTNFSCTALTNAGSPSSNNPISYYAIGQKP